MSNTRRDFLKMSAAAAAALTLPDGLFADGRDDKKVGDETITKHSFFRAIPNHVFDQGYAYLITRWLNFNYPARDYQFFNRGISGNTIADLAARWQQDTLDLKPDLLLVGVNDVFGVVVKGEKRTHLFCP